MRATRAACAYSDLLRGVLGGVLDFVAGILHLVADFLRRVVYLFTGTLSRPFFSSRKPRDGKAQHDRRCNSRTELHVSFSS
jgi:hypothetical protein